MTAEQKRAVHLHCDQSKQWCSEVLEIYVVTSSILHMECVGTVTLGLHVKMDALYFTPTYTRFSLLTWIEGFVCVLQHQTYFGCNSLQIRACLRNM